MPTKAEATSAKAPEPGIDTEQLAGLMEVLKGAKSVELKLTIPDDTRRAADQIATASTRSTGRSGSSRSSTLPT